MLLKKSGKGENNLRLLLQQSKLEAVIIKAKTPAFKLLGLRYTVVYF